MILLVLLILASPLALGAQELPGEGSARTDTLPLVALPAIEVQVLRTPLPRNRAPLSVSVLGRQELTGGRAGTSLEEALQGLPGIQIQNRYNYATGERIVLRGLGARTQFGIRGLRVEVDGVPATLPDGQTTLDQLDFLSLGRVEVLRGPASALYGNGAGGVLRFTSLPPPREGTELNALAVAGSHGLHRMGATLAGAAGAGGYRIGFGFLDWAGYRTDPLEENGTYGGVRRWTGNALFRRPLAGGTMGITLSLVDQDSENPGSLSRALLAQDPTQAFPYNVSQRTGEEARQGTLGISWERPWRRMTLDLGLHGLRRELWNPIPPAIIDLSRESGGFRGRIRGIRSMGSLDLHWVVGGEAEGLWDRRRNFLNQAGRPGEATLRQKERVLGLGAYIQGQVEWGARLQLLGGLRLDRVQFRARDRLVTETNPDDSGTRAMGALSPSLGLRIRLSRVLSLRGSASTFFETPTTSELANRPSGAGGMNPALDPQHGRTLEMGLEARPGPRLQLEAMGFWTRLEDQLIPFEVPSAPGRSFFRNAGSSRIHGLELSAFVLLSDGLRIRGAYTFTDARFREFELQGVSMGGNRLPGVTRHRLEAVPRWDVSSREGRPGGFLELRLLYNGDLPVDDANSDFAAPFALVDLRGEVQSWRLGKRELSFLGGVTNLLDRSYSTAVSVNAFGGRYFEPGPGRSFYLGIRAGLSP